MIIINRINQVEVTSDVCVKLNDNDGFPFVYEPFTRLVSQICEIPDHL